MVDVGIAHATIYKSVQMDYTKTHSTPRIRLKPHEYEAVLEMRGKNGRAVLAIGDLHEPFCLDEYLDFNIELANKYNITDVVFMGDVIDNHYSSYHETDPDGMGAGNELELAQERIERWHKAFPKATVIIGNHDRMIMRKAFTGGIPRAWIRDYKEVLNTPKWEFVEHKTIDDVLYVHGDGGGKAIARARKNMQTTVCGHWHTEAYTQYVVGARFKVFGMQVGCGIDKDSYAMAYAKHYGKPAIGSGVILEEGTLPINVMMDL